MRVKDAGAASIAGEAEEESQQRRLAAVLPFLWLGPLWLGPLCVAFSENGVV